MNEDPKQCVGEAPVDTADELKHATQHSSRISPVFGDIAAKMQLAAKREIQRLLSIEAPIIVDRGNGIEELHSLPDDWMLGRSSSHRDCGFRK
jgi:hypothetical protein